MDHGFYDDRKFCSTCETYVAYLKSVSKSFCTQCGEEVQLFSEQDREEFQASLKDRRARGGRPRNSRPGSQSA